MTLSNFPMPQQKPIQQYQYSIPQIDTNQLKSFVNQLTTEQINQLVLQARSQGISDSDIEEGIRILKNL